MFISILQEKQLSWKVLGKDICYMDAGLCYEVIKVFACSWWKDLKTYIIVLKVGMIMYQKL